MPQHLPSMKSLVSILHFWGLSVLALRSRTDSCGYWANSVERSSGMRLFRCCHRLSLAFMPRSLDARGRDAYERLWAAVQVPWLLWRPCWRTFRRQPRGRWWKSWRKSCATWGESMVRSEPGQLADVEMQLGVQGSRWCLEFGELQSIADRRWDVPFPTLSLLRRTPRLDSTGCCKTSRYI